ncbi:hypothetical protein [Aurantiacibacter aquimixticola]|uniref:hypothetical protein n=1 Tax=Aurantiacibacter aquimixticola TaxID=1958945 RepID=UPI0014024F2F|nr:hypothetical protein [Aurantiacibacter aquimixticola]
MGSAFAMLFRPVAASAIAFHAIGAVTDGFDVFHSAVDGVAGGQERSGSGKGKGGKNFLHMLSPMRRSFALDARDRREFNVS